MQFIYLRRDKNYAKKFAATRSMFRHDAVRSISIAKPRGAATMRSTWQCLACMYIYIHMYIRADTCDDTRHANVRYVLHLSNTWQTDWIIIWITRSFITEFVRASILKRNHIISRLRYNENESRLMKRLCCKFALSFDKRQLHGF